VEIFQNSLQNLQSLDRFKGYKNISFAKRNDLAYTYMCTSSDVPFGNWLLEKPASATFGLCTMDKKQGDQMSLRKNRPKCSRTHFFAKINA
jgi:hypothetical protein